MVFYFDQSRCINCNTCTIACKDRYEVNSDLVRYITKTTYETDKAPFFNRF